MSQNRPHYHVWLLAASGRAWFRLGGAAFWSRQAANQWCKRNKGGRKWMVQQCEEPACAPRLD